MADKCTEADIERHAAASEESLALAEATIAECMDGGEGQQTDHQKRIEQFMRLAKQTIPEKPTLPDEKVAVLRARLIFEEAIELVNALGVSVTIDPACSEVIFENLDFWFCAEEQNLERIADGCADLSVVTIGTLSACGIRDAELLAEVDESNLRKIGPGGYKDEHGKWRKPPDWQPPDIAGVLNRQGVVK